MLLTACEPGTLSNGTTFQRQYIAARKALEAGSYDSALRGYAALIPHAGPLEPRVRLEYAHALLRASRYDEAAQVAGALATGTEGSNRAAALAVLGTAQHESALADIAAGRRGPGTVAKLRSADAALKEMQSLDQDMDPLGAMADRRTDIARELKQLGA
ncbi:hypothetical protein [uncultured Roseovarius sp.]|uniref:hypothetical protein n=1 Tax=uncultured Roseovarius sp. TaxID=293344 RepID=UPI002630CE65|nr:hypothetical protein [uncultured Roseovarius sp.]